MSAPPLRKKVLFTFGNHMHWVDMQWLWGYGVLPGSVRDMLHLCREAGVKGNINFDGIGYEKMAAECPEALAELREAVKQGIIEPVGCSYGQPYGLFHGGESNIRQFTFGVRSVLRLLGMRPRAFWEEEFYFFPQLPQILRGCGFECANLFFQWTWHTPEVPREPHALILWEGIDGTRIPTLPRNGLNLHQWPEDFELLSSPPPSEGGSEGVGGSRHGRAPSPPPQPSPSERGRECALLRDLPLPAIVQWLELMPSKDWMCRSELLLPKLKELLAHPEYEIVPGTMSEVVAALRRAFTPGSAGREGSLLPSPLGRAAGGEGDSRVAPTHSPQTPLPPPNKAEGLPIRAYTMDDVWHGMTLGKNGDRHPRTSRRVEQTILAAESLSATAGLFGRPYASWDVYPTWELDEAWRELLAAQHHDNHECEGLCGFVGYHQMEKAERLAREVWLRTARLQQDRAGTFLINNALGFEREVIALVPTERRWRRCRVAAFGRASLAPNDTEPPPLEVIRRGGGTALRQCGVEVEVDHASGLVTQIRSEYFPHGVLAPSCRLPQLSMRTEGSFWRPNGSVSVDVDRAIERGVIITIADDKGTGATRGFLFVAAPGIVEDAVDLRLADLSCHSLPTPDPGLLAALRWSIIPAFDIAEIRVDSPCAVHAVRGADHVRRKYPSGDWMTSPQWFEEATGAIASASFVDLIDSAGNGLLICHDGSQQWFRTAEGVEVVLRARDPWDEARYDPEPLLAKFRLVTHGPLRDSERVRLTLAAREDMGDPRPGLRLAAGIPHPGPVGGGGPSTPGTIPPVFAPFDLANATNVIAHAFFRMCEKDGEHLPHWAGHRMMRESGGACTHPFVVRLVEWDGEPAEVILKFPGEIAMAAKTNLMGEVEGEGTEGSRHRGIEEVSDTRWLTPEPAEPPEWAQGQSIRWSQVRFTMRPREIATIMADLVMGRKQFRDLDAKREVWATVHRKD